MNNILTEWSKIRQSCCFHKLFIDGAGVTVTTGVNGFGWSILYEPRGEQFF
jgi:hypothetical protein